MLLELKATTEEGARTQRATLVKALQRVVAEPELMPVVTLLPAKDGIYTLRLKESPLQWSGM